MLNRDIIRIEGSTPPVVEFDASVSAWYIRFSRAKVVRTTSPDRPGHVVAVDFDAAGKVVGVELIGVKEFSIAAFLKIAHMEAPNIDFNKARFVMSSAPELQPA